MDYVKYILDFILLFKIKICDIFTRLLFQTLYFCSFEAYARNAHCSRAGPSRHGYTMALPDPDTYQNLNGNNSFPGFLLKEIITNLPKFSKSIVSKAKKLYSDGFIKYRRTTEYNSLWYVRGAIRNSKLYCVCYRY